ncbi:LOW QUALITY PROTEIN: protein VAC14 homolog [Liolophura sinensis]|uniref:LOW QUALITY PROTEIN: protein VAC14 homolog n=1 Tax=Liolophura sinensis TaxID=3198878 RepID=UPI0031581FF0
MSDRDQYLPLTPNLVRSLNDKLYEKRKVAALEIEKMVKDYLAVNQRSQVDKLIKVLDDFAISHNPNTRKGGLIGLAATAIGLGKESSLYVHTLVRPVISCFHDQDSRVRYYACEALYNIVKVARGAVLVFFNDIFDGLAKLATDPDQNVKNGTELLDRLMKDIVTETSFDLVTFIPLLRERVYSKNPFARQFVVSWISVLDAVPDINMLILLPEILDGLFQILGDTNQEIRKMAEAVLAEFLKELNGPKNGVNFAGMANILILHIQSPDNLIQFTAILWLKKFLALSERAMLPFASGIISAILPCLAYEEENRRNVRESAKSVNLSLQKLISSEDDRPTPEPQRKNSPMDQQSKKKGEPLDQSAKKGGNETVAEQLTKKNEQTSEQVTKRNGPSTDQVDNQTNSVVEGKKEGSTKSTEQADSSDIFIQLEVESVIRVLSKLLDHFSMQTRIAALRWFSHLLLKIPNKTFRYADMIFPLLMKKLCDTSDEVVLLDLEALAEISSNPAGEATPPDPATLTLPSPVRDVLDSQKGTNKYFTKFMGSLMKLFSTDRQLLDDRGPFIIRQLSLLLNAEDIFRSMSEILVHERDLQFACTMVQTLNLILLTSTELFELRNQLKDLKTKESCSLFCCLYRSWCHSPVATVSLCYLTQNYKHACDLTQTFGSLELTVDFLKEIDKLVQLIESPIFAYLRLQLLDIQHNQYLLKSLYGLLMLLPQSEAFKMLRYRLECVPHFHLAAPSEKPKSLAPEKRPLVSKINFDELLAHFLQVQEQHRGAKRRNAKSSRSREDN